MTDELKTTVADVKDIIRSFGFRDVRIDRLVHATGFGDNEIPIRSLVPGSNYEAVLGANEGRTGPIFAEVGYGSSTIRVRLFHGTTLMRLWDLSTRKEDDRQWVAEFDRCLNDLLAIDIEDQENWRTTHAM